MINHFLSCLDETFSLLVPTITHLAAMYNVLFMIMMSWMSSLWRWVLFLPGLWPTNAGYCFVSARK